jgi:hypothetical protein
LDSFPVGRSRRTPYMDLEADSLIAFFLAFCAVIEVDDVFRASGLFRFFADFKNIELTPFRVPSGSVATGKQFRAFVLSAQRSKMAEGEGLTSMVSMNYHVTRPIFRELASRSYHLKAPLSISM